MGYAWLQPTLERISDLLKLPDRHNSYGSAKVDPDVALNVLDFLSDHMGHEDPLPTIIPTAAGGLHLEWKGVLTCCQADFNPGGLFSAFYGLKEVHGLDETGILVEHALITFGSETAA